MNLAEQLGHSPRTSVMPRRGRRSLSIAIAATTILVTASASGASDGQPLFADDFSGPSLAAEWEPLEGTWRAVDGKLVVDDGGLIALRTPPRGRFAMEFDIRMPTKEIRGMAANWISVIPLFSGPEDYAALYFGSTDWRSFEKFGDQFAGLLVHRDEDVARNGAFRSLRVECDFGTVHFSIDGKAKEPVDFPSRPGSRIAFRSLPGSGRLEIRRFRLIKLPERASARSEGLPIEAFAHGRLMADRGSTAVPGVTESPDVDRSARAIRFSYDFEPGAAFESRFLRVPIEISQCRSLRLDIDGDGSRNAFFLILHDASGEQHLLPPITIAWTGRQEVDLPLGRFAVSPSDLTRLATHWGGDGNQRIDFPVRAVDVGIAKRAGRRADSGTCSFQRPCVTE
jgi:hypothetical protein